MRAVWNSESCDVFIDEAGKAVGQYNEAMIDLATMGRHWGHNVYFITQRATRVSPNVRENCHALFCFYQALDSAKLLAADWGKDELLEACNLARFEYIYAERFRPTMRGKTTP